MQNEGVENKKWWIACCKGQRIEKEPPNEDGKQLAIWATLRPLITVWVRCNNEDKTIHWEC